MWCPCPWTLRLVPMLLLAGLALAVTSARPAPGLAAQPRPLANVRGVVWYDDLGDGRLGTGSPPASNARLVVHPDPGLPTIYANSDGNFAFSVPEGTYTVEAWWDGPEVTSRAPNRFTGAYSITTFHLVAGVTRNLSLGVRPTGRFPARVDAKIEVVWPHDRTGKLRSVAEAPLANLAAHLFHADTPHSVPCSYSPQVSLVAAINDRPGEVVAEGVKRLVTVDGRTFPVWEFNDVDVSAAEDPANRIYLWLRVADGLEPDERSRAEPRFRSNVWAHGVDGRTYSPERTYPRLVGSPENLAARIDVLWPNDGRGNELAVDRARFAHVDVLLLEATDPRVSVPPGFDSEVWLLKSLNGGMPQVIHGRQTLVSQGDLTYPKWVFEDVAVGEARDPANRYYFRVAVAGRDVTTNVWAHGLDARTYHPSRELPEASALDCHW